MKSHSDKKKIETVLAKMQNVQDNDNRSGANKKPVLSQRERHLGS